ncbi:MAG: UDP-N-acetylmuramate dehydrogenase [Bacteroidales bacterium]|jgi:UDP-N-acetylmuramate dehydrogenase|nr:UDP-N-acetylmuramate dehydrogenase [Bacteroidales bacterium]
MEKRNLKSLNTFAIDCVAKKFVEFDSEKDFEKIDKAYRESEKVHILAGGSNTVFLNKEFDGTIIKIENKGKTIISEEVDSVAVEVNSGENWAEFVRWACLNGFSGLENLAAIPGQVGASPVQNIGAYGSQVADRILWVEVHNMKTSDNYRIMNADCEFDYRFSRWKTSHKEELIYKVVFLLDKVFRPQLDYAAIRSYLEENKINEVSPLQMCDIVTEIRNSKLPDPEILPNAGSFFKNPTISQEQFEDLKQRFPQIVSFSQPNAVKLSAAWLIEQCGFKGERYNHLGMHAKQALVMVNYGDATGEDVLNFANLVIEKVEEKFGVRLEIEAHLIK